MSAADLTPVTSGSYLVFRNRDLVHTTMPSIAVPSRSFKPAVIALQIASGSIPWAT